MGGQRGLTLVEILTVLAVIGILSALTISALSSLSGADNLDTGGSMIVDLANQARQNSASQGVLTALVMVNNVPNNPDANNRLFILLELPQGEDGTTSSWQPVSKWCLLPKDVMVDVGQSSFTRANFQPTLPQALPTLSYLGAPFALNSGNCSYQIFMPDGQLAVKGYAQLQAPDLRMARGKNGSLLASQSNFHQINFNLYTGTPSVVRP